ncbi:MAG: ACT domain-containing protein [Nitrososphaeria archaeon]
MICCEGSVKNKLSIARIVRSVVDTHPSLIDCLRNGSLNYTATSKMLRSEVSKLMGTDVEIDAIKMALIRYGEELKEDLERIENNIRKVLAESTLQMRNDVVVITTKWGNVTGKLDEIIRVSGDSRFFQITQGITTFTIVIEKKIERDLVSIIGEHNVNNIIRNQSAIILLSPEEIISTPGVIAYITWLLSKEGINITQIISCHLDTIFIVSQEQALKAYKVLEDSINHIRRFIDR